ncbi:hypothetical protein AVEN_176232-1 [Araneus ventricosus]|uniref:Uncharacterized protein n=1 Tax=Araneus ventricosus TaxID=182803 RepID=A0A4Y2UJB2_ARAVE|nr:hypothetical protein AVEN_176232-1 [Araneus ventricosus]
MTPSLNMPGYLRRMASRWSSDYFLFLKLKELLFGTGFSSDSDVKTDAENWLNVQGRDFYHPGLNNSRCKCGENIFPKVNSMVGRKKQIFSEGKKLRKVKEKKLGREFYRGKYGMTGNSHVWSPVLGDHLGDKFGDFGDEIWDLKGAGIFSISLLAEEIRLNVLDDSMRRHGLPGETI